MTGLVPIVMPKWGLAMEEGTIAAWHFREGDAVPAGAELADIETSKLLNTLEAREGGTLLRILCPEGAGGACGALIAVMAEGPLPSESEIDAFIAGFAVSAPSAAEDGPGSAPAQHRVSVDGIGLNSVAMGAGEATVLFFHGFGGDSGNWRFVQGELAAHYRTVALDLPGHGASDKALPGDGSLAALTELIAKFLETLGPGPVHLVGHSFGGALARRLAARGDPRIGTLTLVAPLLPGVALDRGFLHDFLAARRSRELREVLSRLVADPEDIGRAMVEDVLRYKRLDGVAGMLEQLIRLAEEEVAAPAPDPHPQGLAIWGERDGIIPVPPAGTVGEGLRLALVPGAGHLPHLERPAETARLIREALGA